MKSVMAHRFSDIPAIDIPRSTFDRSHGFKTTFDAGYLIPCYVDEALPGDTFDLNLTGFARMATPIYPIMDNMFMETFFFSVPIRLIWNNWQKFCGERIDPTDSIDYLLPVINNFNNAANGSIYDYMGLPTKVAANIPINALPLRAYNLIWNEWFRDQNLQDSVSVDKDDGHDDMADYTLLKRCKKHDYFTSCLPWLQKGDSVQLSLGTSAPIAGLGMSWAGTDTSGNKLQVRTSIGQTSLRSFRSDGTYVFGYTSGLGSSELVADLTEATAGTINELRQAFQVQKLLEKDARSGTRYTEILRSHFGVTSDDARLQRPEYLGGGSTLINIAPVPRTDSSPGKLGAYGVTSFSGHGFQKSFNEHCIIIGLVNVRADITYQEGIDRMWRRRSRYDFYWPSLANLGEQAVLNEEIYVSAATVGAGTNDDVFGYQERFAEYRYKPSKITGQFRSNDTTPLHAWHLGLQFGAQPTLDSTFIQDNPPIDRVIATPTEPHFIYDSYINLKTTRPMPVYSIPGYIDHF